MVWAFTTTSASAQGCPGTGVASLGGVGGCNYCSIQDAINAVVPGGPRLIVLKEGPILVSAAVDVSADVVIAGGGPACQPIPGKIANIVSAAGTGRVMDVWPRRHLGMTNVRLIEGRTGGDGGVLRVQEGADVELRDVHVLGGAARGDGGCIAIGAGATVDLTGFTRVGNCRAAGVTGNGGAVAVLGTVEAPATFRMWDEALIDDADAHAHGGGIFAVNAVVELHDCAAIGVAPACRTPETLPVSQVHAGGDGGAIFARASEVVFDGEATVTGAIAEKRGGCVSLDGTSSLVASEDAAFSGCEARGQGGGGIDAGPGTLVELHDRVQVHDNGVGTGASTAGGGIRLAGGASLVADGAVQVFDNGVLSPADRGGGIALDGDGASATLMGEVEVENNEASEAGGGIYVAANATLTAGDDVSIALNGVRVTPEDGGGIALDGDGATAVLTGRVSVNDNDATVHGGGVSVVGDGALLSVDGDAWNWTLADQTTPGTLGVAILRNEVISAGGIACGGGGVYAAAGAAVLAVNLVVAENVVTSPSVDGRGGGLSVVVSAAELINSVVSANQVDGSGGGIAVDASTPFAFVPIAASLAMSSDFATCQPDGTTPLWENHYCSEVRANVARGADPQAGEVSDGGGIWVFYEADLSLSYTALQHNSTEGDGSSLYASSELLFDLARPDVSLVGVLSADNGDAQHALVVYGFDELSLESSTFADAAPTWIDRPLGWAGAPPTARGNIFWSEATDPSLVSFNVAAVGTCNVGNYDPAALLVPGLSTLDDPEFLIGYGNRGQYRPDPQPVALGGSVAHDLCKKDSPYDLDGTCRPDDNCLPNGGGPGAGGDVDAGAFEVL